MAVSALNEGYLGLAHGLGPPMYRHRVKRREFIAAFGCAVLWPFAAPAQPATMPIVGFVSSGSPGSYPPLSAFLRGLGEIGFVEGRDFAIEYRWAHGRHERLPALVNDLVQRKVSVIAASSTPAAMAAKAANAAIPTVFTMSGDPVQLGLVCCASADGAGTRQAPAVHGRPSSGVRTPKSYDEFAILEVVTIDKR